MLKFAMVLLLLTLTTDSPPLDCASAGGSLL